MTGRISDTPAPVTIPTGKWLFEIEDCGVSRKTTGTKAWFNLTPVEPADTGDEDTTPDAAEVEQYAGDDGLEERVVYHGYPEDRAYECTKFMKAIGVDTESLDWRQLDELAGIRFYAVVSHDPNDKDPQRPWVRLRGFEPGPETEE